MGKVYGLFVDHGNYAMANLDDVETFPSLKAAKEALSERFHSNGVRKCQVQYAGQREDEWVYFPGVSERATLDIYTYDPRGAEDPYPDIRLSFGPRGGVRQEFC